MNAERRVSELPVELDAIGGRPPGIPHRGVGDTIGGGPIIFVDHVAAVDRDLSPAVRRLHASSQVEQSIGPDIGQRLLAELAVGPALVGHVAADEALEAAREREAIVGRPTLTRSRTPSPSSRRSCAKPPHAPSTTSRALSAPPSTPSHQQSAPTTSPPPATMRTERNLL